jgi:hypothetical protein
MIAVRYTYPALLRDLMVRLAQTPAVGGRWTERIYREWTEAHRPS